MTELVGFVPCGNCGACNAATRTVCVCCKFKFAMNKHNRIRVCKNPDCTRAAYAVNGLCKQHALRRLAAQAVTAAQADCKGCRNKLSLASTEAGEPYCGKCLERHAYARELATVQPATVEVDIEKLLELLDLGKDFQDPGSDLGVFLYFDKLLEGL